MLGGFVGATREGVTTTLGRGGSDYSAAIVGACLGAGEIQIWTDVDGMLTADPRIVPDPYVVPHLSFAEASELAYFGAKVLHPATIQPAVARNIPVRILNSHRPHARGTLITGERPPSARPLTAIASKKQVSVVSITSTRMLMAHGFLRRLFEVFEQWKTAVDVITTSEVTVSVTVDDRRRLPAIVEALSEFAEVEAEHDMAIVCVVGEGLQTDPQLIGQVLQSVGDVPIRLVSQAASRRNVTFVIREERLAARARPAAPAVLRAGAGAGGAGVMRALLLVGHGRMGKLVEALAPEYDASIAGVVTVDATPSARCATAISARSTSPSISRSPTPCRRTCRCSPHAASTSSLARPAGRRTKPSCASWSRKTGIGVLAAANFSLGMNLFQLVVEDAARRFAPHESFGAWIHELHHAAKKDAPSGTALQLKAGMERAGYTRPIDVSSTRAGSIPGHAHRRIRRPCRHHHVDAHGPRPRRLRARRARGRALAQGPARVVHDERYADDGGRGSRFPVSGCR